jgi:CheY-like chemotaxis protein
VARILIVEDNADLLRVLAELLSLEHEVATATEGEEAVAVALEFRPDAVILDLQLPRLHGIDAGKRIKAGLGAETRILALTALAEAGVGQAVLASGCCDGYLAKPATFHEIRRQLDALLAGDGVERR